MTTLKKRKRAESASDNDNDNDNESGGSDKENRPRKKYRRNKTSAADHLVSVVEADSQRRASHEGRIESMLKTQVEDSKQVREELMALLRTAAQK